MTIEVMDLLVLIAADVTLQCMLYSLFLDVESLAYLRLVIEILHGFWGKVINA